MDIHIAVGVAHDVTTVAGSSFTAGNNTTVHIHIGAVVDDQVTAAGSLTTVNFTAVEVKYRLCTAIFLIGVVHITVTVQVAALVTGDDNYATGGCSVLACKVTAENVQRGLCVGINNLTVVICTAINRTCAGAIGDGQLGACLDVTEYTTHIGCDVEAI